MKLSPKKELAARMIAQGHTQVQTYKDPRINVTKQTMSNWNQESEFKKRVQELQTDTVVTVQEILMKSAPDAADALVKVVTGKSGDDDPKMIALKLKGSLWLLERVLGKSDKIKSKPTLKIGEDEDDGTFAPDEDEIDEVLENIG